jgi:hypothetical protein
LIIISWDHLNCMPSKYVFHPNCHILWGCKSSMGVWQEYCGWKIQKLATGATSGKGLLQFLWTKLIDSEESDGWSLTKKLDEAWQSYQFLWRYRVVRWVPPPCVVRWTTLWLKHWEHGVAVKLGCDMGLSTMQI